MGSEHFRHSSCAMGASYFSRRALSDIICNFFSYSPSECNENWPSVVVMMNFTVYITGELCWLLLFQDTWGPQDLTLPNIITKT